jgi:multicomponent K+:H+ antiporter subunit E
MKRWLPFPLLWLSLVALWLLLNQSVWLGHILLGSVFALVACLAFRRLRMPQTRARRAVGAARRLVVAAELTAHVAMDIVRSNIAVARIVLHPGTRKQTAGFLEIPLTLRDPGGLAVLACIITATPGTAWARYDAHRSILTMHILDLIDEAAWIDTVKGRYERRLLEIFE